jgi:sugar lactone lactonase YvrE
LVSRSLPKISWTLVAVGLLGCPAHLGAVTPPHPKANQSPVSLASSTGPATPELAVTRIVDQLQAGGLTGAVTLVGRVKLISDHGGAIVSNNGGAIVSNNGSSIISDSGAGLVGRVKRQLLAATPAEEAVLADAVIDIHDANDRLLTDKDGKPLSATSDHSGAFKLAARLPHETLLLHVHLFNGGTLLALAAVGSGVKTLRLDVDTASSLGASYVLAKYVNGDQAALNRLPVLEAAALHRDLENARGNLPPGPLLYQLAPLAAAVEGLRAKAAPVDTTLDRIKAIVLLGQKRLGAGVPATQVALSNPVALTGDGASGILIGEGLVGRIRRLAAPGDPASTLEVIAGTEGGKGALATAFTGLHDVLRGPDGSIYVAEASLQRVRKIAPDGSVVVIAGTGAAVQGVAGGLASETSIMRPQGLALAGDGTLFIAEGAQTGADSGRLLSISPAGTLTVVTTPVWGENQSLASVVQSSDGTLFVLESKNGTLAMRTPSGTWSELGRGLNVIRGSTHLLAMPDGGVWLSEPAANQIEAFTRTGARSIVAGTGRSGFSGDGGPATAAVLSQPAGMFLASDGTVYEAEAGNGLVRAIAPNGTIRTVAGAQGLSTIGAAQSLAVNGPGAMAFDQSGRLLFAEAASGLVKRLDGGQVSVIAGTSQGFAGDGGQATAASFDTVTGLALQGDRIVLVDSNNACLRSIAANGTVTTIAGRGQQSLGKDPLAATSAQLKAPFNLAVGPDGLIYFSDTASNQIIRLTIAGNLELVAGSADGTSGDDGDRGPAVQAHLYKPTSLAFGPDGSLYVADTGNLRVRRIDKAGLITAFAGLPKVQAFAAMLSMPDPAQDQSQDQAPAASVALALPVGLAFDHSGDLSIGELGTALSGSSTLGGVIPQGLPTQPARIRRISMADPAHPIHTIAGPGSTLLADPTADDALHLPVGLAFGADGRLAIADNGANQIQLLPAGAF